MQMKNKIKSEKGIMTMYVTVAVITFTTILVALFSLAVATRKNQIKTLIKIKEIYEQDISEKSTMYQKAAKKRETKITVTVEYSVALSGKTTQAVVTYDEPEKVQVAQCKYVCTTSESKIGTNISSYTGGQVTSGEAISIAQSTAGTYYLHVLTTFISGKAVELISKPITVVSGDTITYSTANTTSNAYYTFTAQATGKYKLQVWGAQGGTRSTTYGTGGLGGYSVGTIELQKNDKLYVYVGGKGASSASSTSLVSGGYNGGGGSKYYGGTGGGATDIRFVSGTYNNSASLYSRVIVAGGGGGAQGRASTSYKANGGAGGGATGQTGGYYGTLTAASNGGPGGTISAAGKVINSSYGNTAGAFGVGGNGDYRSTSYYGVGAGGGGWYGGGTGYYRYAGGGGGSGWIYTQATYNEWKTANATDSANYTVDTKYYLTDASTSAGNQSFESTSGGTETGHSGDGYAKITPVEVTGEKTIVTYE